MAEKVVRDISTRKIIGMPVYSCNEGLYLGNIRQLLVDVKACAIQGFILERRRLGKDERILPFEAVYNFGEDGVTVETATCIERRGQSSRFIRALRHPVSIIGSRVFTTGGRTLGKIEEYRFNSATGKISGLEIAPDGFFKVRSLVNGEHIIAIAGRTVMLKDEATDDAMDIENPFLTNMGNAAKTVKEKASEFMSNTADMTKRLSANINEKMEKMKKRDADFNETTSWEEEQEKTVSPNATISSANNQEKLDHPNIPQQNPDLAPPKDEIVIDEDAVLEKHVLTEGVDEIDDAGIDNPDANNIAESDLKQKLD